MTTVLSSRTGVRPRRRTPSRATALVAAVTTLVVLAAGCAATASAEAGATPDSATLEGAELPFGTPHVYDDGLFVQVKSPAKFTPSAQAEWDRGVEGVPVRIHFTITNGTDDVYTAHTLGASVVSGGVEAVPILDPGSQIDLTGPSLPVRRANVVNFALAFLVQDPADVTLTVLPAIGGYGPLVLTTD